MAASGGAEAAKSAEQPADNSNRGKSPSSGSDSRNDDSSRGGDDGGPGGGHSHGGSGGGNGDIPFEAGRVEGGRQAALISHRDQNEIETESDQYDSDSKSVASDHSNSEVRLTAML